MTALALRLSALDAPDQALVDLGRALADLEYAFVTVTPETHERVLARDLRPARTLRDVFGWNRVFAPEILPRHVLSLLEAAGATEPQGSFLRSKVRYSTLYGRLFVHSGFPTTAPDSVFFGPDTYRFCAFVRRHVGRGRRLIDVGCGSGAGGLAVSRSSERIVLADVNPRALRLARVNAALAGVPVQTVESDVLSAIRDPFDRVIANAPYLRDVGGRLYRDGGGRFGEALAVRIAREALRRLESGGRLLLYAGAPIVAGVDVLRLELETLCRAAKATFTYEELDPDVFGSELEAPTYAEVERIAAVGLVAAVP